MNTNVNYTLVGSFVIILSLALIAFLIWMAGGINHTTYQYFEIDFNESISGLSVQSPVKYNGLQVGYVKNIQLNHDNPGTIEVLVAIQDNVPIYENTQAQLQIQGLTGTTFVELIGHASKSPLLQKIQEGHNYPIIPVAPSIFTRVDVGINTLINKLNQIAEGIDSLANSQNRLALQNSLHNMDVFTHTLAKNSQALTTSINNIAVISTNLKQTSHDLPMLINNANHSLISFQQTLTNANNLASPLQTALQKITTLAEQLSNLSQEISQNPSIIIRGRTAAPLGPGEK